MSKLLISVLLILAFFTIPSCHAYYTQPKPWHYWSKEVNLNKHITLHCHNSNYKTGWYLQPDFSKHLDKGKHISGWPRINRCGTGDAGNWCVDRYMNLVIKSAGKNDSGLYSCWTADSGSDKEIFSAGYALTVLSRPDKPQVVVPAQISHGGERVECERALNITEDGSQETLGENYSGILKLNSFTGKNVGAEPRTVSVLQR